MIENMQRLRQAKDFSGLRFGSIMPTDLDGIIDYHDKAWVVIEYKSGDAPLNYGQRLAFERLCRDLGKLKPTIGIIATHDQPTGRAIDCANALVSATWEFGGWRGVDKGKTVRQVVHAFIQGVCDDDYSQGGSPTW